MSPIHWFSEDLIDTDAKALGVYLALLMVRFKGSYFTDEKMEARNIITIIKEPLSRLLIGNEMYEAVKSAELFLKRMFSHHTTTQIYDEKGRNLLEEIEAQYYDRFKNACYKYFKRDVIGETEESLEITKEILREIKKGVSIERRTTTSVGTVSISETSVESYLRHRKGKELGRKYYKSLLASGIFAIKHDFNIIVPAPFLEDEFIEKLAPPEEVKRVSKTEEISVRTQVKGKPEWKKLEEIVRDVLVYLGFSARTNERLRSRGGGEIEVDVWADKRISGTKFYVYASCKYWNKDVDRRTIDEEFGRTLQLINIPHLKIFIAKRLTEPAKSTALADGFIVIELGEKASMENPEEIYNIIYSHLRELFVGIAPPELQRIAREAKEISERLKSLAEEIEKIST
ncbi:MAG: restriction endonuclease [Candidatus Baldrarchaeia archaeon]